MGFGLRWRRAIAAFLRLRGVLAKVWRTLVYKGARDRNNKQVAIIASFFYLSSGLEDFSGTWPPSN